MAEGPPPTSTRLLVFDQQGWHCRLSVMSFLFYCTFLEMHELLRPPSSRSLVYYSVLPSPGFLQTFITAARTVEQARARYRHELPGLAI